MKVKKEKNRYHLKRFMRNLTRTDRTRAILLTCVTTMHIVCITKLRRISKLRKKTTTITRRMRGLRLNHI